MTGVDRIRAERQRQLEIEGYGIKHDRLRSEWSLIVAAIDAELAKAGALIAAAIDAELGRIGTDLAEIAAAEDDCEDDDRWHEADQDWQHPETVPDRSARTGIDLTHDSDGWAQDLSCPSCGAQPGHPHDATCEEIR